jgi:hypothetical protein
VRRESLILQLSERTSEGGAKVFRGSEGSSKCTRMGAEGVGNFGRLLKAWEHLEDQARKGTENVGKLRRLNSEGHQECGKTRKTKLGRVLRAWESSEDQARNNRGAGLGTRTRTRTKTKTETKGGGKTWLLGVLRLAYIQ